MENEHVGTEVRLEKVTQEESEIGVAGETLEEITNGNKDQNMDQINDTGGEEEQLNKYNNVIDSECQDVVMSSFEETQQEPADDEHIDDSEENLPESMNDSMEDDRLLSDISDILNEKNDGETNNINGATEGDLTSDSGFQTCKLTDVKTDNMETSECYEELENASITEAGDMNEDESNNDADADLSVTSSTEDRPRKTSESAYQKLASLGVIAEEKITVESKECLLKKLASRGGISITPASGTSSSAVVSPKSTKKPVSEQPNHGIKSTKPHQKAKKIKIDPGNSTDIEKDFDSIINALSTGTEPDNSGLDISEKQNISNDDPPSTSFSDELQTKPEGEHHLNDSVNEIDSLREEMEVDSKDDQYVHETDTESHDEWKSVRHVSDNAEEIEERVSAKPKNVIEEGSAEILLSPSKNVFYNKVQEFNRDMSIAALTVFSEMHQQDPRIRNRGKKRKASDNSEIGNSECDAGNENIYEPGKKSENGITILEALSATGLRSIRYAREIPGVKEVIANDLSEDAVETIKKNVEHNKVEDFISTTMSDASLLMYQRKAIQEEFDAIDLDPYGSPNRFLDAAVQAVRDGGVLLVTCTDMAVLAGNSPETCYIKYGAVSLRSQACHEMALRIALQCIESHANRYGRYIVPLLSFSADFYIRVIVQVYTSPVTCKKTTSKLSMVYQCVGCHANTLQPLGVISQVGSSAQPKFSLPHSPPVNNYCLHCNHKHYMGGPIWSAPIHNNKFIEGMLRVANNGKLGTAKRMQGMLEVIREELSDVPLYYTISGICTKLHCQAIPLIDIRSAILNAGYKVSSSHAAPTAVKTNAPMKVIWDIMRCWVHMNPVSQKRLVVGSVPAAIILEPPNLIANFDIHPRARPSSSMRRLLRYQPNPEKNWGPGMRARCNNSDESQDEKRRANQNKNKNKVGPKKHIDIIEVVTIDDDEETTATTSTA